MYLILITFLGRASIFSLIFPIGREKRASMRARDRVESKMAPRWYVRARPHSPPSASKIERQIASPYPPGLKTAVPLSYLLMTVIGGQGELEGRSMRVIG